MKQVDCLIIDDEPDIRELLEITLSRMGITTHSAGSIVDAKALLKKQAFKLCLTDMRLPDGDGIELVKLINREYSNIPVAMITAHGNMQTAVEALKAGAFDFVSKPVDLKALRNIVESALKLPTSEQPGKTPDSKPMRQLLGQSKPIEAIRAMTKKLSRTQAPVHITGESGTGKELAARMIHHQGPRSDKPFIAINCGAIPHELLESEFFGHKKGSFTGAISHKEGLFQTANHGTLFLDEVAELPLAMQVKLLRAIQEKVIRPVGGTEEITVDIRVISATHQDLHQLVLQGRFREDLFYRINVIKLALPSLREHKEDIPQLVNFFLDKIASDYLIEKPGISDDALAQLVDYPFPGNVRELENLIEGAAALCENNQITRQDLKLNSQVALQKASQIAEIDGNFEEQVENYERSLLERSLQENKWNKTSTAEALGLTMRQLRYKMEKLDLNSD